MDAHVEFPALTRRTLALKKQTSLCLLRLWFPRETRNTQFPFPFSKLPLLPPITPNMAPATTRSLVSSRRRTEAPRRRPSPSTPPKNLRPMSEIMARAKYAVVERADYSDIICEQCGSGERPGELLLCDKCDKGFHMRCLRPIVVRIPIGSWLCPKCSGHRRVRSRDFFFILPFYFYFVLLAFFSFLFPILL